jgi:hypothetical protein
MASFCDFLFEPGAATMCAKRSSNIKKQRASQLLAANLHVCFLFGLRFIRLTLYLLALRCRACYVQWKQAHLPQICELFIPT